MDQEKLNKVIDRIAKLRALSTSSNANEAAAAAAAAARLMDEHNIQEAELEAAGSGPKEGAQASEDPLITSSGRSTVIAQWKIMLASALAQHFGVYFLRIRQRGVARVMLSGRPSDVQVVRYFYAWLSAEIERLSLTAGLDFLAKNGRKPGLAWHVTYKNGVSMGISHQLDLLKRRTRPTITSSALVILDSRVTEAEQARLALLDPKMKIGTIKHCWGSDRGALRDGIEAGKNIHLGQSIGVGDGTIVSENKRLK